MKNYGDSKLESLAKAIEGVRYALYLLEKDYANRFADLYEEIGMTEMNRRQDEYDGGK